MDDPITPVPGQEGTPPPATQTPAEQTPTQAPPEQTPATPTPLTRDDVDAMLRERLESLMPEISNQIQGLHGALREEFTPRTEVQKASQSAADKAFARAMKQLAPQMKGIDRLVQKGRMTTEDGEAAKLALLSDSAGAFAEDDEDKTPPATQAMPNPFPSQAQTPARPPVPTYDPRQAAQEAANALIQEAGIKWDDVSPEMYKFRASMRRDMNLGEFTKLVAKKVAEKEKTSLVAQAKREYEQQTKAVREADKNGATLTPPQGGAAGHTPKATLDDADDIGEVLARHFGIGKQ